MHQEKINQFRNTHKIHVSGSDIPDPVDNWSKLVGEKYSLSPRLLEAITADDHGYSSPTPIQMQAIPLLLEHREVLACAPTGSGKTLAYLIPLIHHLNEPKWDKSFRGVILSPTRELAAQIYRECVKFSAPLKLKAFMIDKVNKSEKKLEHHHKYDILITTPNRLVYMLKNSENSLNLEHVEWLIIDESDKLFEAGPKGFREQLAAIYQACSKAKKAMFSATLAPEVEQWCSLNLDNSCSVSIGARNTANHIVEQSLVYTGTEKGKLLAFRQLLLDGGLTPPVLVFVQTKERAKELFDEINGGDKQQLRVGVLHAERSQLQRLQTLQQFRAGYVWVLICTELVGRGIDFKGVNLVVNYDFPPSTISYIHRVGRTGRAGRPGKAITYFTDKDKTLLRSIAQIVKDSGNVVPDYMLKLKKATRQEKRKLAKHALKRENISTESKYDKEKRMKLEAMIKGSKNRKKKAEERKRKREQDHPVIDIPKKSKH